MKLNDILNEQNTSQQTSIIPAIENSVSVAVKAPIDLSAILDNLPKTEKSENLLPTLESQAAVYWPVEKRTIYCKFTGQPFGKVSEEYVIKILHEFTSDEISRFQYFLHDVTIFAGPCPLWQRRETKHLAENKKRDPIGFLIYMIVYSCELERTLVTMQNAIDLQSAKIKLFKNLTDLVKENSSMLDLIDLINEILLIHSGKGDLPPRSYFPAILLSEYGKAENLLQLHEGLKNWQKIVKRRNRKAEFDKYVEYRNKTISPQHRHLSAMSLGVEKENLKIQDTTFNAIMALLLSIDREQFTRKDRKTLYKETGQTSPLKHLFTQAFKSVEQASKAAGVKNILNKRHTVITKDKPFTIKFASKK